MTYYPITKEKLQQVLTERINELEAELAALNAVAINNNHKTLTNKAVWSEVDGIEVKVGDYIGLGKALYIYYKYGHKYEKTDITAYTYYNEDGTEIGTEGIMRISRTMTPAELQKVLDSMIEGRKESLKALKLDLVNAGKFVTKYNKLAAQMNELTDSATWATRSVLK